MFKAADPYFILFFTSNALLCSTWSYKFKITDFLAGQI